MSLTNEDKQWIEKVFDAERVSAEQRRDEDRQWFAEHLERVETKLLTAFHQWASPMEARQRTHAATLRALDLEMEALDDRMKKLEPGAGA